MITDAERLATLKARLQAAESESPEALRGQIAQAEGVAQAEAAIRAGDIKVFEAKLAELHKEDAKYRAAIFDAFEHLAVAFEQGWLHSHTVGVLRQRLERARDGTMIPPLFWAAEGAPTVPNPRLLFGGDCGDRLRGWALQYYGPKAKIP